RALEGGRELGFFGQRAKEAGVDDRVHDLRKLSEAVGESWRGAKHQRDQGDQIGILSQQRKQPPAAVQPGEEAVECYGRRIRICRAGEMLKQHRHDFGELAARERALECAVASRAQRRTRAEVSSGRRKPISVNRSRVSRSSASDGKSNIRRLASMTGAFSNSVA